jgi:predicted small lipoprotein YifL
MRRGFRNFTALFLTFSGLAIAQGTRGPLDFNTIPRPALPADPLELGQLYS